MPIYALKAETEHDHVRLDIFLSKNLPDAPSRTFVKKLVTDGHVLVNAKTVKPNYKVKTGDVIDVEIPEALLVPDEVPPENIPLEIFYEDQHLLVINKPSGMTVHPAQGQYTGTLVNALLYHCRNLSDLNTASRPGIVHRLDKDTSGLLVVAKNNRTHAGLAKQFKKSTVYKRYVALVEGRMEFEEGVVDVALGRDPVHREKRRARFDDFAKTAKTFYRVIRRGGNKTLVALFPKTGRMHQLRVHMSYIKHPVLGDQKYGRKGTFPRLALHAQSLGFVHPDIGHYIEFSTVMPAEFQAID